MGDEVTFRSKYTDPDYRRDPKTKVFCFICQRDIAGVKFYGHSVYNGQPEVVHPEDSAIADREVPIVDNYGMLPAGSECVKRIGKEWFVPAAEMPGLLRQLTEQK